MFGILGILSSVKKKKKGNGYILYYNGEPYFYIEPLNNEARSLLNYISGE